MTDERPVRPAPLLDLCYCQADRSCQMMILGGLGEVTAEHRLALMSRSPAIER